MKALHPKPYQPIIFEKKDIKNKANAMILLGNGCLIFYDSDLYDDNLIAKWAKESVE